MNTTKKIAFGGVFCALSVVLLLCSLFPYATYATVALASMMLVPVALEFGLRFGLYAYIVTSVLGLIVTPDPEAKLLFILFFGYYPICQIRLQICRRQKWATVAKYALFNVAVLAVYAVLIFVIGMPMEEASPIYMIVLWCAANAVFSVYDRALTRVGMFYRVRIHPLIKRFLK